MAHTTVDAAACTIRSGRMTWVSAGAWAPSRSLFFAALVGIGFANGISEKVHQSIRERGLLDAAFNTFDISLIIWGSCFAALVTFARAPSDAFRRGDILVGGLAGLSFLAPVPALSWLGLCLIALYVHATASGGDMRRTAIIVFALTLPLFWARLLFVAFSDTVLGVDAYLVGWLVGTTPQGNVVPLADGAGSMFIAPGCSSVANLSLAVLSATVFLNLRGGRWSPATLAWAASSAIAVVVINVVRIGLIGLYPAQYDLIHGPIGASITNWLVLAVVFWIGYHKIGRDAA